MLHLDSQLLQFSYKHITTGIKV